MKYFIIYKTLDALEFAKEVNDEEFRRLSTSKDLYRYEAFSSNNRHYTLESEETSSLFCKRIYKEVGTVTEHAFECVAFAFKTNPPQKSGNYLVFSKAAPEWRLLFYNHSRKRFSEDRTVTHWAKLPEVPPKEEAPKQIPLPLPILVDAAPHTSTPTPGLSVPTFNSYNISYEPATSAYTPIFPESTRRMQELIAREEAFRRDMVANPRLSEAMGILQGLQQRQVDRETMDTRATAERQRYERERLAGGRQGGRRATVEAQYERERQTVDCAEITDQHSLDEYRNARVVTEVSSAETGFRERYERARAWERDRALLRRQRELGAVRRAEDSLLLYPNGRPNNDF